MIKRFALSLDNDKGSDKGFVSKIKHIHRYIPIPMSSQELYWMWQGVRYLTALIGTLGSNGAYSNLEIPKEADSYQWDWDGVRLPKVNFFGGII